VQHDVEQEMMLSSRLSPLYLAIRFMLDFSFALCGSFILLCLLPLLSLLILLDSPGPIFYRQERVGYRGAKFRLLKFRSMYVDAELPGEALWAAPHDARVTRVGRLLRSLHLDELPQVFNILLGQMSLIGPRPEREPFVLELEKLLPAYRARLLVKPGLTGWAQVNNRYARTVEDSRIKLQYDLYYIAHQSLKLDMIILAKTVLEVISLHGT